MPNDTTAVTTMAPLLLLVVTQLGTVGKDADLCKAVKEQRDPLGFPVFRPIFPPLGRLNFVHGSSLVILNIGLLLVASLGEGWVRLGLLGLLWAVFVMQPVLEVDEYGQILNTANRTHRWRYRYLAHISSHKYVQNSTLVENIPDSFQSVTERDPDWWLNRYGYSFHVHGVLVSVITLYIMYFGRNIFPEEPSLFVSPELAGFFVGLVLLNGVEYLSFTWLLHAELAAVSDYEPADFPDEVLSQDESRSTVSTPHSPPINNS